MKWLTLHVLVLLLEKKMAPVKVHGVVDENYRGHLTIQKYSLACRKELSQLTYIR